MQVTGEAVLRSNRPERQRLRFRQFLESMDLRLLNTWGTLGEAAWTFQSDGAGVRSQIDFIGVTGAVVGEAWVPERGLREGWARSDHKPVVAGITVGGNGAARVAEDTVAEGEKWVTFKGWEPAAESDLVTFGRKALNLPMDVKKEGEAGMLFRLDKAVHDLAKETPHTTTATRAEAARQGWAEEDYRLQKGQ